MYIEGRIEKRLPCIAELIQEQAPSGLSVTQHISAIVNLEWSLHFTEIIHWN